MERSPNHLTQTEEEPAFFNVTNQNYTSAPIYTISGQQEYKLSTEEELANQEDKLNRWEKELESRENAFKYQTHITNEKNWPPIPKWCHKDLKPCFYQNINKEIGSSFQNLVRHLYFLWIAHTGLLLVNMLVGILYMFVGGDNGETFGLSLLYMGLYTPLSFVCWFRPAYKGFRDNSSLSFMLFFFVFSIQLLVSIIYALGIGSMGSCGLILGVSEVAHGDSNGKVFVGICMIIVGIGFAMCAIGDYYLLITIHRVYRSTGASVAKAKNEFASGVMRNEDVQIAVSNIAKETVKHSDVSKMKNDNVSRQ